jgi:hypothetical protein
MFQSRFRQFTQFGGQGLVVIAEVEAGFALHAALEFGGD